LYSNSGTSKNVSLAPEKEAQLTGHDVMEQDSHGVEEKDGGTKHPQCYPAPPPFALESSNLEQAGTDCRIIMQCKKYRDLLSGHSMSTGVRHC
jgi:hypothetical protein